MAKKDKIITGRGVSTKLIGGLFVFRPGIFAFSIRGLLEGGEADGERCILALRAGIEALAAIEKRSQLNAAGQIE